MSDKNRKEFIITNIIINIIAIILICLVDYLPNIKLWIMVLLILAIVICSSIINSLVMVYFLKKNKLN